MSFLLGIPIDQADLCRDAIEVFESDKRETASKEASAYMHRSYLASFDRLALRFSFCSYP